MRLRHAATAAVALACAALPGLIPGAAGAQERRPFTFVALGDMPYRLPDDYARFERLIDAINAERPAFSVHVGDTKSGGSSCADETLIKVRDYFNSFERPLVYTPGDNEWTDCYRPRAGGFDPLERLERVRELHFAEAKSLGVNPMPVERQADVSPEHRQMVENARWIRDGVVFATIHVVGSNNGFERTPEMVAEHFARDAANVDWIEDAFATAAAEDAPAIVFAFQTNPMFDTPEEYGYANQGFRNTLTALAEGAAAFDKPVLLVQGDLHVLVIDKPLRGPEGEAVLENVTPLQVMGADQVQAVRVTVDPNDPAVFGFKPLIVPENMSRAVN